jgi:hypothetical protein
MRQLELKVIGSMFQVQARPGATGCSHGIVITVNGFVLLALHLNIPGLGQGFKGYKMLISVTLCSIVWIGLFHPLGETWNSILLTRNTIVRDQLGYLNREPLAQT